MIGNISLKHIKTMNTDIQMIVTIKMYKRLSEDGGNYPAIYLITQFKKKFK